MLVTILFSVVSFMIGAYWARIRYSSKALTATTEDALFRCKDYFYGVHADADAARDAVRHALDEAGFKEVLQ